MVGGNTHSKTPGPPAGQQEQSPVCDRRQRQQPDQLKTWVGGAFYISGKSSKLLRFFSEFYFDLLDVAAPVDGQFQGIAAALSGHQSRQGFVIFDGLSIGRDN